MRLGEFHICMSFLSVIGKRLGDTGLTNILVDSGIIAQGSVNSIATGRHYNRRVTVHTVAAEALRQQQVGEFLTSLNEDERYEMMELCSKLNTTFPKDTSEVIASPSFLIFVGKFTCFRECRCQQYSTFKLCDSYTEMVEILLTFICATQVGD